MDSKLTQEQIVVIQQRLTQLGQMFQQAQPSAKPSLSSSTSNPLAMDTNKSPDYLTALHSLEIRPTYA